MLKSYFLDHI